MRKRILLTSLTAIVIVLGLAFLSNQLTNLLKTEETPIKTYTIAKSYTITHTTTQEIGIIPQTVSTNLTKPLTNTSFIETITTTEVITVTKIMPKLEKMVEVTLKITITKTVLTETTSLTTRNFTTTTITSG
ncbi:hypothetical protein HRbin06_00717 [archaeon HR06]|nr:hypothetical protein HRbin06_00717 [archaeon HR06]